jgi:hypothetical protein
MSIAFAASELCSASKSCWGDNACSLNATLMSNSSKAVIKSLDFFLDIPLMPLALHSFRNSVCDENIQYLLSGPGMQTTETHSSCDFWRENCLAPTNVEIMR